MPPQGFEEVVPEDDVLGAVSAARMVCIRGGSRVCIIMHAMIRKSLRSTGADGGGGGGGVCGIVHEHDQARPEKQQSRPLFVRRQFWRRVLSRSRQEMMMSWGAVARSAWFVPVGTAGCVL